MSEGHQERSTNGPHRLSNEQLTTEKIRNS